jgi:hypothetical protein
MVTATAFLVSALITLAAVTVGAIIILAGGLADLLALGGVAAGATILAVAVWAWAEWQGPRSP